ncbi:hypothetical protein KIN20_026912 [Parelaphostrongylus tenuis]|uniref:Uncharacterized protein n=1 Tax=Parelaphostrongylus tenuis TaxID=148309 RepID=A0AAD5QYL9_PARTN|nr:hypothetical protein KIN20_026912 [Parelaphostrongylus tenuis]
MGDMCPRAPITTAPHALRLEYTIQYKNNMTALQIKAEITANLSSSGYLTVVHVDFSSFESIERCAEKVKRYVPHLDGLFNNIAAELCEREITKNDMEYVQQVSAIGHLTLTQLLLPALTTACGRVVSISSILSKTSGSPNVDEISYVRETYKDVQAYSRSKLLISIITLKLAQRSSDIRFFSTDPGITEMPLWSIFTTFFFSQNGPYFLQTLCSKMHRTVGISPTQAALRVIALGFSPMFDKYSGGHLHNYCFCEVHPMMKELEKIDDIWNAIKEKLSDARFFCDRVPSLMDLQDVDLDKKKKSGEDSQDEFELRKGLKKRFISSKNLFVRQKDP